MKPDSKTIFSADLVQQEISADPVVSYVSAHHVSLWQAARLLGGYESARLVDCCAELLAEDLRLTPRTRIMLDQILEILCTDDIDDPEVPCMGSFAIIDARNPVANEICLLADGIRDALVQGRPRGMAQRFEPPKSSA
ncbi:hypothetical protein [Pseudooceanicola sp.]|jgi:hypothetical protein|uniref:hypothetical protein n=1 Tax=Pseudooceanicola sp. TaxID=1914328 RepID=UPI0040591DF5